jgi:hypothetical protein
MYQRQLFTVIVTASEALLLDEGEEVRIISYRQFRRLWQELVSFVTTMKPSSDLCFVCQENVAAILRSINLDDDEKSEKLKSAEEHLKTAKKEREAYNDKKEISKANWKDLPHNGQSSHGKLPGVSMLYSFDHAQLVHIPSNPLQPGQDLHISKLHVSVRYLAYVVKGVVSR